MSLQPSTSCLAVQLQEPAQRQLTARRNSVQESSHSPRTSQKARKGWWEDSRLPKMPKHSLLSRCHLELAGLKGCLEKSALSKAPQRYKYLMSRLQFSGSQCEVNAKSGICSRGLLTHFCFLNMKSYFGHLK